MGNIITKIIPVFLCVFSSVFQACIAQCIPSPVGLTTINTTNTIINSYYPGEVSVSAGSASITLGSKRGSTPNIADGDLLLIIQMQGVEINTDLPDDDVDSMGSLGNYADGDGGHDRSGFINNSNYIAGTYEYVVALGAISGNILNIRTPLVNSYVHNLTPSGGLGARTFQIVRVANYQALNLSFSGSITGLPWNGRSGGVIAIDVNNNFALDGIINADGLGFRGGGRDASESVSGRPGHRGEGIAGTPRIVFDGTQILNNLSDHSTSTFSGSYVGVSTYAGGISGNFASDRGMGAPGNAGGAGYSDGGGGGGSNAGDGGIGSIGTTNPFGRISRGGASINSSSGDRLFLGGGGGSGGREDDSNDTDAASSGQPGGGIIITRANTITGNGWITSSGLGGFFQQFEGGGGGGAGGTILIHTSSDDLSSLVIFALGGDGNSVSQDVDGGGGGGSGGAVLLNRIGGSFSFLPSVFNFGGAAGASGSSTTAATGGDGGLSISSVPSVSIICNLGALPITLLDFNAKLTPDKEVLVSWSTIQEINNAFFSIERATDGLNFEEILRVEGAGNSAQLIQYKAMDKRPQQGLNYYRLRQIDFDGTSTLSDIVVVDIDLEGNPFTVYPNPSTEYLQIESYLPMTNLRIWNASSSLIHEESFKNDQIFQKRIQVSDFASGVYFIEITTIQSREIKRFIKK